MLWRSVPMEKTSQWQLGLYASNSGTLRASCSDLDGTSKAMLMAVASQSLMAKPSSVQYDGRFKLWTLGQVAQDS
jgi:hypothetical protein